MIKQNYNTQIANTVVEVDIICDCNLNTDILVLHFFSDLKLRFK